MNMTLDELKARAKADLDNAFEKGKAQGGGGDAQTLIDCLQICENQWRGSAFPEGFNFVIEVKSKPVSLNGVLMNTTGVKTAKIVCDVEGAIIFNNLVRNSTVEVLDLTDCKLTPTQFSWVALQNKKLISILGEIDMSNCTAATIPFNETTALKDIAFKEGTINISISFANCSLLSDTSIQSIIDGLADLTGGTAQKVEFHSSITDKLTSEQYSQIWAKNWTTE